MTNQSEREETTPPTNEPSWEMQVSELLIALSDETGYNRGDTNHFNSFNQRRVEIMKTIHQTIARERADGAKEIVSKIRGAFIDYPSPSFDDMNDRISEVLADYLGLTNPNDQSKS